MRLVHGTRQFHAERAPVMGLSPRGRRKSQWDVKSHPAHVYLTSAYAIHYAVNAAPAKTGMGLVEVETDLLDEDLLRPDEDPVAQCMDGHETLLQKTAWARDNMRTVMLKGCDYKWSLEVIGNCAYAGAIPGAAVTRVVWIDNAAKSWLVGVFDPTITCLNFRILGRYYQELQKLFLRRPYDPEAIEDRMGSGHRHVGMAAALAEDYKKRSRIVFDREGVLE